MREELSNKLYEKHARLFKRKVPFECRDGWYHILDKMMSKMNGYILSREKTIEWSKRQVANGRPTAPVPEPVPEVSIDQIKEKFGTLRFYYQGGDEVISGIVMMGESMSEVTCEECGNVGQVRSGSWIRTLCDQHHVKRSLGASDEFMA